MKKPVFEEGKYYIEHAEDCNCSFKWDIDGNGELVDNVDSDACWEGNVLYITGEEWNDGEPVAEYIRYEGLRILHNSVEADDIPDHIKDEMRMSDMKEQGETGNPKCHDTFRREALVEYLMDCGYELDRDDNRGFANEYTMILRDTGDRSEEPTADEAEEWADAFLYSGDAATESFVNFKFEEA